MEKSLAFTLEFCLTLRPPTVPGTEWPPADSVNYTMYPLSVKGPYYAIILGVGTLDTNGGPIINPKSQVMSVDSRVDEHLLTLGTALYSPFLPVS